MNADGSSQGLSYPWLRNYPAYAPWNMPLPAAPVFNILHDAAAKFASRPAMDFFGKHWTYA